MSADLNPDHSACEVEADVITLFECPGCEWSATTGAPWTRCSHCGSAAIPTTREMVDVHALYDVYKATSDGIPLPFGTWMSQHGASDVLSEVQELREAYETMTEQADALRAGLPPAPPKGAAYTVWVCQKCNEYAEDGPGAKCEACDVGTVIAREVVPASERDRAVGLVRDIADLTTGHECDGEVCLLCLVEGIAKGEVNTDPDLRPASDDFGETT